MTNVLEHTNGHRQKGRAAPSLPRFVFPDSGIEVGLRRFAPDTQDQISRALMRQHPAPGIPMAEGVEKADGSCEMEPNPADPDYQKALVDYLGRINLEVSQKMVDLALRRIEVDVDEEAVTAYRKDMEAIGVPIDADIDDRTIYIRHICISSTYDLSVLLAYLTRRSLPTEAAVQEYLNSFQRDV